MYLIQNKYATSVDIFHCQSPKNLCFVSVSIESYLAGLFWLWLDADEDIQLLHNCCDTLGLHLNVLFNVKH